MEETANQEDRTEVSRLTEISQDCYKSLAEAVKTVNTLPMGEARDLHSTYTGFHAAIDHLSENVLMMANSILKSQDLKVRFKKTSTPAEMLSEINDCILDNVHSNSEVGKQARASNAL